MATPEGSLSAWHMQHKYARYWGHYKALQNWLLTHRQQQQWFKCGMPSTQDWTSKQGDMDSCGRHHKQVNCERGRRQRYKRPHSNNSYRKMECERRPFRMKRDEERTYEEDSADDEEEETHEFQMEVTEEMMKFFALSAEHRKQRDEARRQDSQPSDYVELGSVNTQKPTASTLPPNDTAGRRRTQEMRHLYGMDAAMIHGMETAMQLTFERNCDRKQAKLWPHLPLTMVFD